jgi:hypothetical protein
MLSVEAEQFQAIRKPSSPLLFHYLIYHLSLLLTVWWGCVERNKNNTA